MHRALPVGFLSPATPPDDLERVEPFDPAALIRRVERRRPAAEVAALFGLETHQLIHYLGQLRRDDPDYPVKRRKLRRVIYIEPAAP